MKTFFLLPLKSLCYLLLFLSVSYNLSASESFNINVKNSVKGAPITVGVPFPIGALSSPDNIRLIDNAGNEIPSQITEVSRWLPKEESVKWVWVFFFSTGEDKYELQYGRDISRLPISGPKIKIKNNQRKSQTSYVDNGVLKFSISKSNNGFINNVYYDIDGDGYDQKDIIATSPMGRGSFLDLIDDNGVDLSNATINRTVRELGSGPLHSIIRLEGEYSYSRDDNRNSPFVVRIHVYAGKPFIKVLHTITYTGVADKHDPNKDNYGNIATSFSDKATGSSTAGVKIEKGTDQGWIIPNDKINGIGLNLKYNLSGDMTYTTGYKMGDWFDNSEGTFFETTGAIEKATVIQSGPKRKNRPHSSLSKRIDDFKAQIDIDGISKQIFQRSEGWADLTDKKWGVTIGIKNFIEEFPNSITFDENDKVATAFTWPFDSEPMSFERDNLEPDSGMVANFAEGVTKTSEIVFSFHKPNKSKEQLKTIASYIIDPPTTFADPIVYSNSNVYGKFLPRTKKYSDYERTIDYKFDWAIFNQNWEPWYGMFDYGDQKYFYQDGKFYNWINNEPAVDFMYWLQFMRTGDKKYFKSGEAMSRHTMDVDNVHWPTKSKYYGDSNDAIDFWKMDNSEAEGLKENPYLGIGRRHAAEHWTALLSAHVWVQGWIASYYLTGYHRGLDIARLTSDSYLKRMWGDHGITGRRLYLSVLNLVETFDATKDPRYLKELEQRVEMMLNLQNGPDQYGSFTIDRYGYSNPYVSHGLYKYHQLTQDKKVRNGLIKHARAVRDNPPFNHEYESLLSTIHSLIVGYELSNEKSFLDEAILRSKPLTSRKIEKKISSYKTQKDLANALLKTPRLSEKPFFQKFNGDSNARNLRSSNWNVLHGLRVFAWTHMYSIPWLEYWMDRQETDK